MELEINQKKYGFQVEGHGAARQSDLGLSLEEVMSRLYPKGTEGMAVAIRHQVVPRADWAVTYLKEQDKLLILTATQGG